MKEETKENEEDEVEDSRLDEVIDVFEEDEE